MNTYGDWKCDSVFFLTLALDGSGDQLDDHATFSSGERVCKQPLNYLGSYFIIFCILGVVLG
jgi:hypothetical protein